jgi:hypothetical protein
VYLFVREAFADVLTEGKMNPSKQVLEGTRQVSLQPIQQGGIRTHQGRLHCMLLLALACTAGTGSTAFAQNLNNLTGGVQASELSAAVNMRVGFFADESGIPEADVHAPASGSSSPMIVSAVTQPASENKQPDITANPGRPAMATSALLTPVWYAQLESGMLYASGSAQFSHRSAEEQTMRYTVAPSLQFILSSEPVAYSSTAQKN